MLGPNPNELLRHDKNFEIDRGGSRGVPTLNAAADEVTWK